MKRDKPEWGFTAIKRESQREKKKDLVGRGTPPKRGGVAKGKED